MKLDKRIEKRILREHKNWVAYWGGHSLWVETRNANYYFSIEQDHFNGCWRIRVKNYKSYADSKKCLKITPEFIENVNKIIKEENLHACNCLHCEGDAK